jgi:hypothetical protein
MTRIRYREDADLKRIFFLGNVLIGTRFDFAQRDKRKICATENLKHETNKNLKQKFLSVNCFAFSVVCDN